MVGPLLLELLPLLINSLGYIEIVKLFVTLKDININYSNTDGVTSLFIACQENHSTIVELLLQQPNIDVNIPKVPMTTGVLDCI